MDHPPLDHHGAQMKQDPMRRSVLAIIQQADLKRPLPSDRLADLHHGAAVGGGPLEDPAVPADDLAARVAVHGEEPAGGEDDGVAGDGRVGEEEAAGKVVEGVEYGVGVVEGEGLGEAEAIHHGDRD